jgi:nitric oxide reductase subunit B
VLFFGLLMAALLYLPGMIPTDNQTIDSYWRWWVVHLWVEGVWELIMGAILSYLLIKLTGIDREVIEKWLYVIVGLTFLSGILGTGHHYYFIGTPRYWLMVGGVFSALEPWPSSAWRSTRSPWRARAAAAPQPHALAVDGRLRGDVLRRRRLPRLRPHLPQVNLYTHGTLVTAMHGHMAFWGAYAMLVLAMISLRAAAAHRAQASTTPRRRRFAFWTSNIGMIAMTSRFAVAGITQVYLERRVGMDFLDVQKEIEVHFWGLILAASSSPLGIVRLHLELHPPRHAQGRARRRRGDRACAARPRRDRGRAGPRGGA